MRKTLEVGQTHFYSRSRRSLWHKGATSGHVQFVESIHVDCDADVLLVKVRQQGGACHEGYHSCFFRRVNEAGALEVVETPIFDAEKVYAQRSRVVRRRWSSDWGVVKPNTVRATASGKRDFPVLCPWRIRIHGCQARRQSHPSDVANFVVPRTAEELRN